MGLVDLKTVLQPVYDGKYAIGIYCYQRRFS